MRDQSPWRRTFLAIAVLAAVAVRLLTPAGWMPGTNGIASPLVICTGEGPRLALGLDLPLHAPDHGAAHEHDHCLFAGFALVGGGDPAITRVPPPRLAAEAVMPVLRTSAPPSREDYRLQAARGPPRLI